MGMYKVTAPRDVLDHEPGSVFEYDFTAADEADLLANGRLELVPREYEVVGASRVCDTKPGGKFKAAFTVGQEQALLDGGHIERVAKEKRPPKPTTTDKKE